MNGPVRVRPYTQRRPPRKLPMRPEIAVNVALDTTDVLRRNGLRRKRALEKEMIRLGKRLKEFPERPTDRQADQIGRINERLDKLDDEIAALEEVDQLLEDFDDEVSTVAFEGDAAKGLDEHQRLLDKLRRM